MDAEQLQAAYAPTTAEELEAIVYEAARANVGANVLNPYDILAAWLAAHDAEVARQHAERILSKLDVLYFKSGYSAVKRGMVERVIRAQFEKEGN